MQALYTYHTSSIHEHFLRNINNLLFPGSSVAFGGKPLTGHQIPDRYGSFQPTAVSVPIEEFMKPANFEIATTELFGPF
jgi:1-pyrroline-5-carboxylate dehydrogenase